MKLTTASTRILGPLDVGLLRTCIELVVERHESLRTRIVSINGVPRQQIDPPREWPMEPIDLTRVAHAENETKQRAQEFVEQPIDLSVGPLFERKLLRLSDREHVLLLGIDHMVSDAASCVILARDLWALYTQGARRAAFALPTLPVQFADYAIWQERTYGAWLKKHQAYWKEHLTGVPQITFPRDTRFDGTKCATDAMLHILFGAALTAKLREVARHERALLPLVVLTAYVAVVSRWCNQEDFVVAFLSHGRHRRMELEHMIGFLANRLHFRIQVAGSDSFVDVLKRVNNEFRCAYQHQDFNRVPEFIPECIPQLYFNWLSTDWTHRPVDQQKAADCPIEIRPFLTQSVLNREVEPSSFTAISCLETAAGIEISLLYPADYFGAGTMERFSNNLRLFVEEIARQAAGRIESVPLIF